jgi:hypothetical protein
MAWRCLHLGGVCCRHGHRCPLHTQWQDIRPQCCSACCHLVVEPAVLPHCGQGRAQRAGQQQRRVAAAGGGLAGAPMLQGSVQDLSWANAGELCREPSVIRRCVPRIRGCCLALGPACLPLMCPSPTPFLACYAPLSLHERASGSAARVHMLFRVGKRQAALQAFVPYQSPLQKGPSSVWFGRNSKNQLPFPLPEPAEWAWRCCTHTHCCTCRRRRLARIKAIKQMGLEGSWQKILGCAQGQLSATYECV